MRCSSDALSPITSMGAGANTATKRISRAVKSAYQITELVRQCQLGGAMAILAEKKPILESSLHRLTDLHDCDREGEYV